MGREKHEKNQTWSGGDKRDEKQSTCKASRHCEPEACEGIEHAVPATHDPVPEGRVRSGPKFRGGGGPGALLGGVPRREKPPHLDQRVSRGKLNREPRASKGGAENGGAQQRSLRTGGAQPSERRPD